MAHTPGPWETIRLDIGDYQIAAWQGPVRVYPGRAHGLEDAMLMAASPALLASLIEMVEMVQGFEKVRPFMDRIERARAAVRQATGS